MLLVQSLAASGQIQTRTFTDSRDGEVYPTLVLGDSEWMRENLRHETEWAFFSKNLDAGGYYTLHERDSICPAGWSIPNSDQWHEMLNLVFDQPQWSQDTLQMQIDSSLYANLGPSAPRMVHFIPSNNGLFADTLMNLRPFGWKEGAWLKNKKTLTLWVDRSGCKDARFHVHQSDGSYVHHTHMHHLEGDHGKPRRFNARCIRTFEK